MLGSTRALVSYHGMTHQAVSHACVAGNLPPDNPFATGLELPYYWVYNAMVGRLAATIGCSTLYVGAAFNIVALCLLIVAVSETVRRLGGSRSAGALAALLALTALNSFGVVILAWRVAHWQVHLGIDAYAASPVHRLVNGLFLDGDVRFGPNLATYLNQTSRGMALALAACLPGLISMMRLQPSLRYFILLILVVAAACAMNSLVGIAAGGAWVIATWAVRCGSRRRNFLVFAAISVGVALALPSYLHLFTLLSSQPQASLAASTVNRGPNVLALLLAVGPLLASAMLGVRMSLGTPTESIAKCSCVAGTILAVAAGLPLSGSRQHTLLSLSAIYLAIPAALALVGLGKRWRPALRRTAIAGVVAFVLLTPMVQVFAYWYRLPGAIAIYPDHLNRTDDANLAATYDWIRLNTPDDAVIVFNISDGPQTSIDQVESEIPAMTNRSLFIDVPSHWVPVRDPVTRVRYAAVGHLFEGVAMTESERASVDALDRTVFAFCRTPADGVAVANHPQFVSRLVFRAGVYAVYQVDLR